MGGEPISREVHFAPNQPLPEGYKVFSEWGERRDGTVGISCYCWTFGDCEIVSEPLATRWEARDAAIEHYKENNRPYRCENTKDMFS